MAGRRRRWTWALIAMLYGCGGASGILTGRDGGPRRAGDGAIAQRDAGGRGDAGKMDAGMRRAVTASFWQLLEICGESVEEYATITEMAEQADAVLVGRLVSVEVGHTVQEPDVPENFYAEANVTVEVEEVLRHQIRDRFALSLVLPGVASPDDVAPTIRRLQATLPDHPVLLLVREREDFANVYRLVNDKGLWARTPRHALDYPIAEDCHYSPADGARFVQGASNLDELIERLRD